MPKSKIKMQEQDGKTLNSAFEEFHTFKKINNLSKESLVFYENKFRIFGMFHDTAQPCESVTKEIIYKYIEYLQNKGTVKDRTALAAFIAQAIAEEANYTGMKGGYAWQIGEYSIDREGTLTGADNRKLTNAIAEFFKAESMEFDTTEEMNETLTDSTTIEIPLEGFNPAK